MQNCLFIDRVQCRCMNVILQWIVSSTGESSYRVFFVYPFVWCSSLRIDCITNKKHYVCPRFFLFDDYSGFFGEINASSCCTQYFSARTSFKTCDEWWLSSHMIDIQTPCSCSVIFGEKFGTRIHFSALSSLLWKSLASVPLYGA